MFDSIIKNGVIVTGSDTYRADIGIQSGKIAAIGDNLTVDNAEIIDAGGKYVFPGGIDVHTHLDMPFGGTVSKDDFATGTVAAACGGTTTVIDFCIQPKGKSLKESLDIWHSKADGKAVIDYGFHVAITDMTDAVLAEMKEVISSGYPSFKLFMTYDGLRVEDDVLLKALLQVREYSGLICVHAENYFVLKYLVNKFLSEGKIEPIYHALSRPALAEGEATGRAIKLAQIADAPLYIVHLTCNAALQEVVRARDMGSKIMAETCPQYLLLSEDNYREPDFQGAKYVMSPPLRPRENQEPLWYGLAHNQLQTVATDHCPFDFKGQKDMGRESFAKIPNGAPGIEARMALLFDRGVNSGKITLNRFVEITSTNPAKIFGLYPSKGSIVAGADADLVIFDPKLKKTISKTILHENVDYTSYEGFKVTGYPVLTMSKGKVIAKDGNFVGQKGAGQFLKRKNLMII
ncbi:MAG: dihydropyrimidinase [Gammaproteobacteria bacterium]